MSEKRAQPQREIAKRRQRRAQFIVLGSGIFIILAVLAVIGAGWYINQYRPLHETVIKVNDTQFDMNYYIKLLRYYGQGQSSQNMQFVADEVARIVQQSELIRQGAAKLGISVTDEEVDTKLKTYDPPLSEDFKDLVRTDMVVAKLGEEYFEPKVPESTEQRQILAMFLESKSQATEVGAKLDNGDGFAELASELSLDTYTRDQKGDLDWRPKGALISLVGSSIPDEYAFNCDIGALSQPIYDEAKAKRVGYWLIKVSERKKETNEVHLRGILLGSKEEAQRVKSSLEAGEDFAALAERFSQYNSSEEYRDDLGWLPSGSMYSVFEEFVSNSELGKISEPIWDGNVSTSGGYWLVKVLDKDENRKVEGENRDLLKAKLLDEWVSSLWDENKVESYLDEAKKSWAISKSIGS